MNHIAILLAAHQLTRYIIEQYYRLYEAIKEIGDLYMLIEDGDSMRIPENIRYYSCESVVDNPLPFRLLKCYYSVNYLIN